MVNREELTALQQRVRAATGPDRSIDAALLAVANPETAAKHPWVTWIADQEAGRDDFTAIQRYTASIDAAFALTERVLPEHDWIIGHTNGGLTIHCQLGPDADRMAFGDTPPLAILAALLSTLIAQAETP